MITMMVIVASAHVMFDKSNQPIQKFRNFTHMHASDHQVTGKSDRFFMLMFQFLF